MKFSFLASVLLNIALIVYAVVTWPELKPVADGGRIIAIGPHSSSEQIKQAGFNTIDQIRLSNMAEGGALRWILVFDHNGRLEIQPLMEVSTIQNKSGEPIVYVFEQQQQQVQ